MRYVDTKNCYCGNTEQDIVPCYRVAQLRTSSTISDGLLSSFRGENKGHSTVGSWGVAWGNDESVGKPSSLKITWMNPFGAISARRCCSPSSDFSVARKDSKAVLSFKVVNYEPSNRIDLKWVENFDSFFSDFDLGLDDKDPEEQIYRNAIEGAYDCIICLSSIDERSYDQDFDGNYESEVNPITCWAENGFSFHVPKTSPTNLNYAGSAGYQKGKINND